MFFAFRGEKADDPAVVGACGSGPSGGSDGQSGVLSLAGEAQRLLARVLASSMAFRRAASPS